MIVIHIGILIYPVNDSAEMGLVLINFFFFLFVSFQMAILDKLNWFITVIILFYCILRCHYNLI